MNRIATILLIVSILFSHNTYSQFFQFTNIKEGSGLPSSETYQVFQDSKGFVWIATDNGVVKYDGHDFVTYNSSNGLLDNTTFGFYEDNKGRIWFRAYNGALTYYENDTIRPYKFNAELKAFMKEAVLVNIIYDSLDNLNFATMYMSYAGKIDSSGNVRQTSYHENEKWEFISYVGKKMLYGNVPPQRIREVLIDGKIHEIELDDHQNQNYWAIASTEWRGKIYFTMYKNIFEYDGKSVKKVFTSDETLICLHVDRWDRLWAGRYNKGVKIFDDQSFQHPSSISTVDNISVSSVMQDYEGGTWVSTLDQGVFYFPNLSLDHYNLPDTKRVNSVVFGKDKLYLGNYGGDVYSVTEKGEVKLFYPGAAPVNYLFLDNDNKLWIVDGTGTHKSNTDVNVGSVDGIKGFALKTMLHVGDTIVGCGSMGFVKVTPKGNVLKRIGGRKRPNCMIVVNNEFYLGGLNGLERYQANLEDKQAVKIYDHRTACLVTLNDRYLATGTVGHGLIIYDMKEDKLMPLPVADVTSVYSMVADWAARRLWIGTEKGLFQLDFEKDSSVIALNHLSKADGLVSTKINTVGRIGDNIWAVSDLGISSVPLDHFAERAFVPKFYINRILFKNESIAGNASFIETEQEDMVLDVRAITFKGRPTVFRYCMHKDDPWKIIPSGSIFLTDLAPGKYEMELQASTGQDNWTKSRVLQINILAKWWETWSFRIGMIVAIMLLGYLGYWLRMSALRRRQKYLELINLHQQRLIDSEIRTQERERKRIASDLHDGIGATLSSIKLQISDVMSDDGAQVPTRAKEINDNLTDVIDDIKRIVYDLHPPGLERYGLHSGLKSLVDRLNKTSDINVIFDYYGQRDIMQPISITIFRILQELINNTLKHARASEIRIHINEFEGEINIMYEDNGIGMIGSRFTGLGLHSIESRVRSLNGRMTWESNHKGTFYNFDIPF